MKIGNEGYGRKYKLATTALVIFSMDLGYG